MDASVLEEQSSFKILRLSFTSKLDWGLYIISIAKTAYWRLDLFYEVSFSKNCFVSL